jgi:hypothetical protein
VQEDILVVVRKRIFFVFQKFSYGSETGLKIQSKKAEIVKTENQHFPYSTLNLSRACFLSTSSRWVNQRLHTGNQLNTLRGSALQVCGCLK